MSHRALNDEQFEDHMPPEPGTARIPEGHVRLFHYTSPENVANISQHGLQTAHARGHTYGEPNMVWAAAGVPKHEAFYNKSYVEFHAHPQHELDIGQMYGRHGHGQERPEDRQAAVEHSRHLESHQSHVTMRGDVPPHRIVGIHEPWHAHVRYLEESPSTREMYTTGSSKDYTTGDADTDRALAYVRAKHAAGGYA